MHDEHCKETFVMEENNYYSSIYSRAQDKKPTVLSPGCTLNTGLCTCILIKIPLYFPICSYATLWMIGASALYAACIYMHTLSMHHITGQVIEVVCHAVGTKFTAIIHNLCRVVVK